jgi:hypothetical protein
LHVRILAPRRQFVNTYSLPRDVVRATY